jgi:O-antigen/teichoic acid export membrane protein
MQPAAPFHRRDREQRRVPGVVAEQTAPGGRLGRDLAMTMLTQVAIGLGGLFVYRLIALEKHAEGVAAYALVKQLAVFVWPVTMIGLHTAIPRSVALVRDRAGAAETYLLAAVVLTGGATAAVCGAALVSPGLTASLFFGDRELHDLVVPFAATLAATVLINVTYGYFRGLSEFMLGNLVRIAALAVFPVGVLLVAEERSIGTLITLMAVLTILPCTAVLAAPLAAAVRGFRPGEARVAAVTLLDYGYRRIPGDLATAALFTLPPILAAHFVDLEGVAYLSAGMYLLSLMTVVFQPIGLVFLPLLSRLCATDFEAARRYVRLLATAAIHLALLISPQLILFGSVVVRAWLGPSFDDAGTIITITVCPAGAFVCNIVLRSALDAVAVTAYNSRNNVISLAVAAACVTGGLALGIGEPLTCIATSLAIGVFLFGLLTVVSVHRLFRLAVTDYALPLALLVTVLTTALAALIKVYVVEDDTSFGSVGLIAAFEAVLLTSSIAILNRCGVAWPRELAQQLRGGGTR